MMLIDSHCHLDFPDFAPDLDAVVARARAAGVAGMVTISTELEKAEALRVIASRFSGVWSTVGIHPHEAERYADVGADDLLALADYPEVVGLGETGLDFHYEHSPRQAQERLFRAHIDAARRSGLPVIVHSRGADLETAAVLADEYAKGPFTGLIHCFSTGRQLAEDAIRLGFFVSLAGIITFKSATELRATVRDLPLDRLLVETDSPYLAPVPNRGKRNEPAMVVHTAACIADLKGLPMEQVAATTTENFFTLFARAQRAAVSA